MTISVAIIVKDEERVIERCLTWASKLGDEVVVIDTGSTDNSKELAKKFPKVKVFDSEFFNKDTHYSDFEFGKARNESLKRCTGDWIFWTDVDDVIDDANIEKIKEIVTSEKRDCVYAFWIISGDKRGEHSRLFQNGLGILFDENHACHEFLNTLDHPVFLCHDVEIQHCPECKKISSHDRNLAIMEKDYFVRKREDQRTLFYLANAYLDSGWLLKAIDFYDKYLAISEWREERFFARYHKGQCLFREGKIDEGRDEVLRALGEDYRFAEAFCFLGDVEMSKTNWERAILWFKLAFSTPFPKEARLFVSENSYSQYPTSKIGECMARLGEPCEDLSSQKKEIFELPEDRGLAMLAAASLSNIVSARKAEIVISPLDEWQKVMVKGFDTLKVGEGKGKKLSLPVNLKGTHAQEWYARSAGYIGINQQPVRITRQVERSKDVVVVTPEVSLPETIVRKIRQAGKTFVVLDPACEFQQGRVAFRVAVAYIGSAGWLQHLAKWTRLPAFVFFDGRNPQEFGWEDQENRPEGDFSGLEEFIARTLASTTVG
jgi:glycosyltransferase involved in cell wall biosynthesis